MASEKTLNAKNLAALGAERLAELLLEFAAGDAAAKRRLRLELASRSGGGDVAAEIRKRLAAIAKARSFVDWRKIKPLAQDIEMQRAAIMGHVAPTNPGEAFDLLWRMVMMAPAIYARCDDSNGTIGSVIGTALADLGVVAEHARLPPATLADRVYQGVCADDHGQFDGLIALMAKPLGRDGLQMLQARFKELAAKPPARPEQDARRIVGYGRSGPVYEDDYEARYQARRIHSALTEIADALGDVDGYAACFSAEQRTNPAIAAGIARRLLGADRAAEALSALNAAEPRFRKDGHWPDWHRVHVDTLDALGQSDQAQAERWASFERSLNATDLRAFIKRLPDFDDEEAELRALAYVGNHPDFNQALAFLVNWPAHDLAAKLVLARQGELDGDHYEVLNPAAEALEQRHPFAATLLLRAMIDFALMHGRYKRYGHAARHLQTCEHLARRIEDWGGRRDHAAYAAHLRSMHGRKSGFWSA